MKVQVFAGLKDYFQREFEVSSDITNTQQLIEFLINSKPESAGLLRSCRFAVNDEFIEQHHKLDRHDIIDIIPPSSGG